MKPAGKEYAGEAKIKGGKAHASTLDNRCDHSRDMTTNTNVGTESKTANPERLAVFTNLGF